MFLEQKDDIYDLDWSADVTYRDLRLREEKEFSEYNFSVASVVMLRQAFGASQKEAARLIEKNLLLPAYDMCLKCSHNFNLLDSRGAISVTERVKMISQIRALVNDIARRYTTAKEGA
jgi:glycyl-tRNA synthetase alpha chain